MTPQAQDPIEFHFDSMSTTEEQERYCPGGFHPVSIGNMLGGHVPGLAAPQRRYRVLHKLGYGSFATVWLARDIQSNTFVALKITVGEFNATAGREAEMLGKLSPTEEDGTLTHALELYDHFAVDGPNGTHQVLVTDVVVPILSLLSRSTPAAWRKAAARGLIVAVAQMHHRGVKHGDLHLGNLGCAFPELHAQEEDDVVQDLSPYDLTVVLPCDPLAQTPSLPPYVVVPCKLAQYRARICSPDGLPDVKILDFGNARETHDPAGALQCAIEACAPEVAFARVALGKSDPEWGTASDVWAVGATIYEIVTGSVLFHGVGLADGLLGAMVRIAGAVLPTWQPYWQTRPRLLQDEVSPDTANEEWQRRRAYLRAGCEDDADADGLVLLLRKVLVIEPERRPVIEELLRDPWFHDSMPPEL